MPISCPLLRGALPAGEGLTAWTEAGSASDGGRVQRGMRTAPSSTRRRERGCGTADSQGILGDWRLQCNDLCLPLISMRERWSA